MKTKTLFIIGILFLVTGISLFAGGNQEPPSVEIIDRGDNVISPNGDEVKDNGTIKFKVSLMVKSNEGYVPEYGIQIISQSGDIVKEIKQSEESDIFWLFALFSGYTSFSLEKDVTWDGTDADGVIMTDGVYKVRLWVTDADGNQVDLDLDDFTIDTAKPTALVSIEGDLIFSPNGDGNKDSITLIHSDTTSEVLWEGSIVDGNGTVVKTYTWENSAPTTFDWDGKNDSGEIASSGSYKYLLTSTDLGGNSVSEIVVDGILLDLTDTEITVYFDSEYFSPNGDGIKDELGIKIRKDVNDSVVGWNVGIYSIEGNKLIRTISGEGDTPESVVFDGKDDSGAFIPEGTYTVSYEVVYENGNRPVETGIFYIDTTFPDVSVALKNQVFSPNGDFVKDTFEVDLTANEPLTWIATIKDVLGNSVFTISSDNTTSLIKWNGTYDSAMGEIDRTGQIVSEGMYKLTLTFTDLAGNRIVKEGITILADVTPPEVSISFDKPIFSPNNDGRKDDLLVSVTASEGFKGALHFAAENERFNTADFSTTTYVWDGMLVSRGIIPDGRYKAHGEFYDEAGNKAVTNEIAVKVDTRKETISLSSPKGFSPNGDGKNDTITLDVGASLYEEVEHWAVTFADAKGTYSFDINGSGSIPKNLVWNGKVVDEQALSEGLYIASMYVEYMKGDIIESKDVSFYLDVTPPAINLAMASDPFAQTEEGLEGDVYITLEIEENDAVETWDLDIINDEGEILRSYSGDGDPSDLISWNGRNSEGALIQSDENFKLIVTVTDNSGNESTFQQAIPLDILVVKRNDRLYLMVPNIIFGAYQAELDSAGPEMSERNQKTLAKVVDILSQYPEYGIGLEAHALNIYVEDENRVTEEEVLVPLTEERALSVKYTLIELDVDEERITTKYYGGEFPIVQVDDWDVNWKNRRVEFVMLKPGTEMVDLHDVEQAPEEATLPEDDNTTLLPKDSGFVASAE